MSGIRAKTSELKRMILIRIGLNPKIYSQIFLHKAVVSY